MSSSPHLFFSHLDPIQSTTTTSIQQLTPTLPSTLPQHNADVLLARFSPIIKSPIAHNASSSSVSPSLYQVLENMQTQISSIMNRLDYFTIPNTAVVQTTDTSTDFRPSSSHPILDASPDALTKRFKQIEAEYLQLKRELNARSLSNHSANLRTPPPPVCHCQSSSAFQPITKVNSVPLPSTISQLVQPNPSSSPIVINNSATNSSNILSKLSTYVPPDNINSAQVSLNPAGVFSPHASMPVPSLIPVPFNSISSPAFTMNLANNFPTFKGMANDKPIKFIKDFEFRVPSHIRNNDILLLETVQQVLLDGALTWFGQLQQSSNKVDRWADFKIRFYERYHTTVNVQNLRTELQTLFQGDKECTLDYFDRLKTLLVEIDPDCSDQYVKRKFVQKMRSDIRSRFDFDINLSVSELVRKAQMIESNIEQQKIDEKLKSAAQQEKKNSSPLLTNNLSNTTSHRPSTTSYHTDASVVGVNHNLNHNNNLNLRSSPTSHHNTFNDRSQISNSDSSRRHSENVYPPSLTNADQYSKGPQRLNQPSSNSSVNNNRSSTTSKNRYWCPHCKRNGHSWERCPDNPDGINYRVNSIPSTNANSGNLIGR